MKRFYYTDAKRTLDYNFSQGSQDALPCCTGVDQIMVPGGAQSGTDKLSFALNINHEHFTLDTGAQALVLKGTMEVVQGCSTYACAPTGGMEYTDGIMDINAALPRATTAFFHAVRLSDFKAFSSEKYNAFTYGFQGNNLTSGGSYPQARITAKWIKGFYCGRLFAGELVLENTVYNNASVLWQYKVANGGGQSVPGLTDPATAVVDLAIEGEEGGARVNFYYRTGGAQSGMDKASGDWTLYASYDNAALPFYGYPVNKGLLTLSASDLAYPPTVPTDNPINSAQSIAVSEYSTESVSADALAQQYRFINFEPASNVKRIVYTCMPGALTAIRAAFSGLAKSPSQLNIAKLRLNGQSRPFKIYRTTFSGVASGDWAIAEAWGSNNFVPAGQSMIAGAQYYLYLFIRDNDPDYDLNMTAGVIEDPTVLGIGTAGVRASAGGPALLLLEGAQ